MRRALTRLVAVMIVISTVGKGRGKEEFGEAEVLGRGKLSQATPSEEVANGAEDAWRLSAVLDFRRHRR